jgi:hypothetical protein
MAGPRLTHLVAVALLAIAAAAGIQLAVSPPDTDQPKGFLAYGRISVAIADDKVHAVETRRCIANSVQAGIDVRQGIDVIIKLDGRAVGAGDLSTGELVRGLAGRRSESSRLYCRYKFSAPVTRPGEGRYTVDVGDAKITYSVHELTSGINLTLT